MTGALCVKAEAAPQVDDSLRADLIYCVGEVRHEARLGGRRVDFFTINSHLLNTFPNTKLFMLHSHCSLRLWSSPSRCETCFLTGRYLSLENQTAAPADEFPNFIFLCLETITFNFPATTSNL